MLLFYTESDNARLVAKVRRKLQRLGFKTEGVVKARVDIGIAGIGDFDACAAYWLDGVIHMPFIRINRLWGAQPDYELLLHEAGHAIAGTRRFKAMRKEFRAAFGGNYSWNTTARQNAADCLTEYAQTNTQEDFAETFCQYALHAGRMPSNLSDGAKAKWCFVAQLAGGAA